MLGFHRRYLDKRIGEKSGRQNLLEAWKWQKRWCGLQVLVCRAALWVPSIWEWMCWRILAIFTVLLQPSPRSVSVSVVLRFVFTDAKGMLYYFKTADDPPNYRGMIDIK